MNGMFWSKTIWYLLLLATSIAAVVVTAKKSPDRKFAAVFGLAALGLTYWIEVMLVLVLDAYTYYPMLTPWDPFQDAVLGNIFSQVSVSTTAVLYCVLNLRSIFIPVFAVAYYLIDVLFVQLGIYAHHWYQSIYTLIGFIPYCWMIKKWYLWLTGVPNTPKLFRSLGLHDHNLKKWLLTGTLFLAIFAAAGNSLITTQKVAGLQIFHGGFFADMSKDHTATSLIYGPVLIVLMIALHRWKRPFVYKAGALLILLACHCALYLCGILTTVLTGWCVIVSLIDLLGYYFWTVFLERLLSGSQLPYRFP